MYYSGTLLDLFSLMYRIRRHNQSAFQCLPRQTSFITSIDDMKSIRSSIASSRASVIFPEIMALRCGLTLSISYMYHDGS